LPLTLSRFSTAGGNSPRGIGIQFIDSREKGFASEWFCLDAFLDTPLVLSIFHSLSRLVMRFTPPNKLLGTHVTNEFWSQFCQDCTCFSQDARLKASI
jgi:hypothetical protein